MACPVITAVTAQTNSAVFACNPMSASLVEQQIETALSSNTINAVKIGMLANAKIVETTAAVLVRSKVKTIILDPVLMSSSGTQLLDSEGIEVLKNKLLPICTVITPNLIEAAILTGTTQAHAKAEIVRQAAVFQKMGANNVLIKGGHSSNQSADDVFLDTTGQFSHLNGKWFPGTVRGTGCALSSAIAAEMATGMSAKLSCERAKKYITQLFRLNHSEPT